MIRLAPSESEILDNQQTKSARKGCVYPRIHGLIPNQPTEGIDESRRDDHVPGIPAPQRNHNPRPFRVLEASIYCGTVRAGGLVPRILRRARPVRRWPRCPPCARRSPWRRLADGRQQTPGTRHADPTTFPDDRRDECVNVHQFGVDHLRHFYANVLADCDGPEGGLMGQVYTCPSCAKKSRMAMTGRSSGRRATSRSEPTRSVARWQRCSVFTRRRRRPP